jgi:hypothetical protein
MKRTVCCAAVICLLSLFSASAFGYLGESIRIMSMGHYLAGVVKDQDTDIYRNPAYLSFVDKVRVFGQYNVYDHTELQIAPAFTNKGSGLLGLALPTTSYGNLAFVCELKPSTSKNGSSNESRTDEIDFYTTRSSYESEFDKKSIEDFKAIYSVTLSPTVRVGADFTYLKNYGRHNSESESIATRRSQSSDEVAYDVRDRYTSRSDDSPDAQRASLGVVLMRGRKPTLDLTFYYESLRFTQTSSGERDYQSKYLEENTLIWADVSSSVSGGPIKNRAMGLDANLKYGLPHEASLVFLAGVRYEKNESSWARTVMDTSHYYSDNAYSAAEVSESRLYDDKTLSASAGIGVEKDFSSSIKVGTACRGYWSREKLDRHRVYHYLRVEVADDSVTSSGASLTESRVKKTANSYELAFPIGAEIVLHKMVKVRLGGAFVIARDETETGSSTSSSDRHYQGVGFSYDDRIFLDAYIEDEVDRLGNWMVKVEYRF